MADARQNLCKQCFIWINNYTTSADLWIHNSLPFLSLLGLCRGERGGTGWTGTGWQAAGTVLPFLRLLGVLDQMWPSMNCMAFCTGIWRSQVPRCTWEWSCNFSLWNFFDVKAIWQPPKWRDLRFSFKIRIKVISTGSSCSFWLTVELVRFLLHWTFQGNTTYLKELRNIIKASQGFWQKKKKIKVSKYFCRYKLSCFVTN